MAEIIISDIKFWTCEEHFKGDCDTQNLKHVGARMASWEFYFHSHILSQLRFELGTSCFISHKCSGT
jgi:hypothetical protein